MLVAKYHESNCTDKSILAAIDKAVSSSIELRSKKDLIDKFVEQVIGDEKLKPDETRKFLAGSFRDGTMKTTGTDIDRLLPPISRFSGGRAAKKQSVIE